MYNPPNPVLLIRDIYLGFTRIKTIVGGSATIFIKKLYVHKDISSVDQM
jgi:hypothetical protein